MKRAALALALLIAGCDRQADAPADTPGARLEQAAVKRGLVADPLKIDPVGSWARDTDRVCVAPGADGALAIGMLVDYGERQGCVASGRAVRHGDRLAIAIGACRFDATLDGDRMTFPADLPAGCERLCTGRASLAALTVDRLSNARSEAATLRTPSGLILCPS